MNRKHIVARNWPINGALLKQEESVTKIVLDNVY